MHFKKFFSYIIVSLFALNFLNGTEILHGSDITSKIEKKLADNSFSAILQEITPTGQDEFSRNILIELATELTDHGESLRTNMIINVSQELFFLHSDEFIKILKNLRLQQFDFDITFLISAYDEQLFENYYDISGTKVFTDNIENADNSFAIFLDLDEEKKTSVKSSCKFYTSPLWLTKLVFDSFAERGISAQNPHFLSSLYRLGFIQGEEKLYDFMSSGIPSISVSVKEPHQFSVIENIVKNYDPKESIEWDKHYILISAGKFFRSVYLSEKSILHIFIAAGILVILSLCSFSFLGAYGEENKKQLIRSLYMIPLTIAVSFISLYMGQKLTVFITNHFPMNPVYQFGLKILFSMMFISVLFGFQESLRLPVTAFVYSYIISLVALFNIFLFSLVDILLFSLFLSEYLIISLSRFAKKFHFLLIFFMLMIVPFVPYALLICSTTESEVLKSIVITKWNGNFFLAFAIFPFQIMWLRILVRLNVYAKRKSPSIKKLFINGAISTGAILGFISLSIFLLSTLVYNRSPDRKPKQYVTFIQNDKNTLSAKLTQDEFLQMNTNHIIIESKERALRYNVSVFGNHDEIPVYDSIYKYISEPLGAYSAFEDFEGIDAVTFTIPDYPPKKITIDYASYADKEAYIIVTAIYPTEKPKQYKTEMAFLHYGNKK